MSTLAEIQAAAESSMSCSVVVGQTTQITLDTGLIAKPWAVGVAENPL